jgi:hypothetical protein
MGSSSHFVSQERLSIENVKEKELHSQTVAQLQGVCIDAWASERGLYIK